jgi:hypothetical protein
MAGVNVFLPTFVVSYSGTYFVSFLSLTGSFLLANSASSLKIFAISR